MKKVIIEFLIFTFLFKGTEDTKEIVLLYYRVRGKVGKNYMEKECTINFYIFY